MQILKSSNQKKRREFSGTKSIYIFAPLSSTTFFTIPFLLKLAEKWNSLEFFLQCFISSNAMNSTNLDYDYSHLVDFLPK